MHATRRGPSVRQVEEQRGSGLRIQRLRIELTRIALTRGQTNADLGKCTNSMYRCCGMRFHESDQSVEHRFGVGCACGILSVSHGAARAAKRRPDQVRMGT